MAWPALLLPVVISLLDVALGSRVLAGRPAAPEAPLLGVPPLPGAERGQKKRRKRFAGDAGARLGEELAELEALAVDEGERESVYGFILALIADCTGATSSPKRCLHAVLQFDALALTSPSGAVRKAARAAAHAVGGHMAELLPRTSFASPELVQLLSESLRVVRDEGARAALIQAIGGAALCPKQAVAMAALESLDLAAQLTVDEADMGAIARALSSAVQSRSPAIVGKSVKTLLRALSMHGGGSALSVARYELPRLLRGVADRSVVAAVDAVLLACEGPVRRRRDMATKLMAALLLHGSRPRTALVVHTVLWGTAQWEEGRRRFLLEQINGALVQHVPVGDIAGALNAFADVSQNLRDKELRWVAARFVVHIFERSRNDETQRLALGALAKITTGFADEPVQQRIVESIHTSLWLGAFRSDTVGDAFRVLVSLGASSSAGVVKRGVVNALAHCLWESSGSVGWFSAHVNVTVGNMSAVAASGGPAERAALVVSLAEVWTRRRQASVRRAVARALAEAAPALPQQQIEADTADDAAIVMIVDQVSAAVFSGARGDAFSRGLEWLISDVMLSKEGAVREASLRATAVLAATDRLGGVVEALALSLLEERVDSPHDGRKRFAIHLLTLCNLAGVKRAVDRLVLFCRERPCAVVQQEVVAWLGGALLTAATAPVAAVLVQGLADMGTAPAADAELREGVVLHLRLVLSATRHKRVVVSGLVGVALGSSAVEVDLSVTSALQVVAVDEDEQLARAALHGLAKIAATTRSAELRADVVRLLSAVATGADVPRARAAVSGFVTAAQWGAEDFRESCWEALLAMRWRADPALRSSLGWATVAVMRMRERSLQLDNRRRQASGPAPAA